MAQNRISVLIDVAVDKANASLKNFRADLAKAEGASGKLKTTWGAASSAISANAGALAASAGAALVSFGVKAVQSFQKAALAAADFGDATGIAVEDASRWIEVAGDFGIEADAVQGALLKMNKAIADGKPAFEQYGVEIVKTKDGLVDSNATFQAALTTIGAIEDPTLRAKAAQEVFGKSYASVARLMEMSATDLKGALDGVSSSQVFTERDKRNAREFQASMDALQDRMTGLTNEVGRNLVPVLVDFAETIDTIATNGAKLDEFVQNLTGRGIVDWVQGGAEVFDGLGRALDGSNNTAERAIGLFDGLVSTIPVVGQRIADMTPDVVLMGGETREAAEASDELRAAAEGAGISVEQAGDMAEYYESRVKGAKLETQRAEQAIKDMDAALQELQGNLGEREAWRNLKESLDELQEKIASGEASWMELGEATDSVVADTARYIETVDFIPTEVKTQLYTMLDDGALNQVLLIVDEFKKGVDVPVRFRNQGSVGFDRSDLDAPWPGGRDGNIKTPYPMAEGGIVMPRPGGTPAILGEAGRPEAVIPLGRGTGGGLGAPVTVNIYPRALPTDRELIDLINGVRRRNGDVI